MIMGEVIGKHINYIIYSNAKQISSSTHIYRISSVNLQHLCISIVSVKESIYVHRSMMTLYYADK